MLFKIGDYVTRESHQHDILFKIIELTEDTAYLKGCDVRLIADSSLDDLRLSSKKEEFLDLDELVDSLEVNNNLNRNEYFYLPGKILHIDGDQEYLERCMRFYKKLKLMAYGVTLKEKEIYLEIEKYLMELRPDIVVITGHDAILRTKRNANKDFIYKNSDNFIKAIKVVREYEKSQDKLIIIAGACQSNYEELIKAGANFASSPKRINIHALDPAIVGASLALSDRNKSIDLVSIIEKTKYKEEGIGGIITNGTMYVGYPR